ncbi:MAG: carboxypeptidase-like regulatory domain-containing protein, partial [Bacteroidetes bacterium]|nr:carboxypeptidase-like regulatory domain-containing protein [Bacteroidota bacterium]
MNKPILAFLLSAFFLLSATAQVRNSIRGKVVNAETGTPIAGASVFITNTSKGTVTDASGSFELVNVPEGAYDLIISSIGFETVPHGYKATDLPLRLEVRMKPKSQELQNVYVEPDEKNGWERWGQFFIESFLGTNNNGKSCRIVNQSTLRFRFSKKRNMLTVIA